MLRLTFFRLWLSEADRKTTISSAPASAARNAPCLFGTSAASTAPRPRPTPRMTSSASASCGTARGETKEVVSIRGTPASISRLMNSIFCAVGMKPRSAWKPSRGPTSVISAYRGWFVMARLRS